MTCVFGKFNITGVGKWVQTNQLVVYAVDINLLGKLTLTTQVKATTLK
jgi:hypothetical protein